MTQRNARTETPPAESAEQTATATAPIEHKPTDRVNLGVGMPFELKEKIESEAQKENKSGSAWARDFLANHFGYTLPESHRGGGKKRYATEEEKEAARELATRRRAALVKAMMSKYGNDPEIQAEAERIMKAQEEAKAKAQEEAGASQEAVTA